MHDAANNRARLLIACAFRMCALISPAHGAEFRALPDVPAVVMRGEITSGDFRRFEKAYQQARHLHPDQPIILGLSSKGGDYDAGLMLAKTVRDAHVETFIPKHATCVSMCFGVFAAGTTRSYDDPYALGVHSVAQVVDEAGTLKETDWSQARTVAMARMWRELGVPASIIALMVTTPPDDVHYLSTDEVPSWWAEINPPRQD